ncbi:hypothetical protein [Thermococcus thioreducens]|uniref:Uncharacterized protein n=1 Tax=Thermococcus thioreducens TaxID=277988 RepID=A0A0Q2QPB3_9EURY|nr:hypothetical protein [Thermococcus thioreducens]ASJ11880.1 hypothetical protein A3L14_02795 [Thermococcus thioreducens]KQH81709.1 hypothetical protein AMR53_09975 [Thermococcus thioreducens]SEW12143.1 hypothetical protein SAMN05216170_1720 [Thermococcus thioreducens]
MPLDVYREALRLASDIRDKYLRAVTYAKIGYYMYRAKKPEYKTAFKYAFNAAASIDNPVLLVKALVEIGAYLKGVDAKTSQKVFHQAYESILSFPEPLKDDLLEELVIRLLELDMPDDALFYATDVKDSVKRNDLFLKILRVYLKKGNMRRARLIIERIDDEPWHSIAAIEAIKEHLKREEFGSAIRVLSELKSEYWLGEAMKEVAVHLKNSDVPTATYEKFVDIALGMSSDTGFDVLKSLLIGLGSQGELDFVMKILERMYPDERLSILEGIVKTSVDKEDVLLALLGYLEGEEFERIAGVIMDHLLSKGVTAKYLPLVRTIGEHTREDTIRVKVVTYLSKLGEFDEALRFAGLVRGNYLRSLAFGSIAVSRLKSGDIDGAIDAALEVKDPKWGSWLLSEILTKILELQAEGEVSEDIEEKAKHQKVLWEKH